MATARVIGVAVSDQSAIDRAAGIDPGISGHHMNAPRLGPDPGKRGGHHLTNEKGANKFPCPRPIVW
ncbi:hypothetical protein MACH05_03360 [Qipengyuania nanhaisediminis]